MAFRAFFGSNGGIGDTDSAMRVIATTGNRCVAAASDAANKGMTKLIDNSDRASKPGRRTI